MYLQAQAAVLPNDFQSPLGGAVALSLSSLSLCLSVSLGFGGGCNYVFTVFLFPSLSCLWSFSPPQSDLMFTNQKSSAYMHTYIHAYYFTVTILFPTSAEYFSSWGWEHIRSSGTSLVERNKCPNNSTTYFYPCSMSLLVHL